VSRRALVTVSVIVTLAGCAPVQPPARPPTRYVKLGATEAEFQRDKYECYRDAMNLPVQSVALGGMVVDAAPRQQTFVLCMQGRGYEPQP
jgi:hypothetical protein